MPHSHKVLLALLASLVISGIGTFLLLNSQWLDALIPVEIVPGVTAFSIFAFSAILVFDVIVVAIEQVHTD